MGLIRLLALIFIIWLVIHYAKRLYANHTKHQSPKKPGEIAQMVRCEKCGLHIPEDEAIMDQEHYYCSVEHRDTDTE